MSRSRFVFWLRFACVQAVVIAAALWAVEAVLAMRAPARPVGRHDAGPGAATVRMYRDPMTLYRPAPNQDAGSFHINSAGLRGPEPARERSKKRVILLGGSSVFGADIGDDETVSAHLAKLLDAEVLNAGVSGFTAKQELSYLIARLVDLEPDLVIALDGWNDYNLLGAPGWRSGIARVLQTDIRRTLWTMLFPRVSRAVRRAFDKESAPVAREIQMKVIARNYADAHLKMKRIGRGYDFQVLSVFQPAKFEYEGYDEFKKLAQARISLGGSEFLDLEPDYRKSLAKDDFIEVVHLNGEGNRALAVILADKIRGAGLLR